VIWFIFALLGLVFGSFFNVCIWRIPRGESINYPPSHCPKCKRQIRVYDNIPLLSYILLKGRCRNCGQPISPRYPVIEVITALLFVGSYAQFGLHWQLVRVLVFIGFLIVLGGIDFDHGILPVKLSLAGSIIGLLTALLPVFDFSITAALWGGLIGAGFVLFAWALWRFVLARPFARLGVKNREGMGWGDLPFAGMIGIFAGPKGMTVGLAIAVFAGVFWGLLARAMGRFKKGQEMPFGPFLALGGIIGLFFGGGIADWYCRLVIGR